MVPDRDRSPMPAALADPRRSRRSWPPSSIVSVSIHGYHRRPTPDPAKRVDLASKIVEAIAASGWTSIDAVLLPGGFQRLSDPIGHHDQQGRVAALMRRRPVADLGALSAHLGPSCTLVAGVDFKPFNRKVGGDQFVAAWRGGDLVALARKTFPADGDTDGSGPVYPVYEDDFASPSRAITFGSGRRALLLGCYDAFGVRSLAHPRFANLTAIRLARDRIGTLRRPSMELRRAYLGQWRAMVAEQAPDLALVAIHNFIRPGADGYWQRHGIAGASAALGGLPVIGAAHFNEGLPPSPEQSPLASIDVPTGHLDEGAWRRPHAWRPAASLTLTDADGVPVALTRRFDL